MSESHDSLEDDNVRPVDGLLLLFSRVSVEIVDRNRDLLPFLQLAQSLHHQVDVERVWVRTNDMGC